MRILFKALFLALALSLSPESLRAEPLPDADKQAQIDMFVDLGVIRYGREDASGSREILLLTKDNTGVFTHQHLTEADGTDFQAIMQARGIIKIMRNPETRKPEKHLMVFNSKDMNTYTWVPFSKLKEIREQIQKTGKTVLEPTQPKRVTESELSGINFKFSQ